MGKLTEYNIYLEGTREVFYPGDTVRGSVIVNLKEEKELKGIKLHLYGEAYCYWTETDSDDNSHSYTATEVLVDTNLWLVGDGMQKMKHSAGRFDYKFNFQLPSAALPSSYEGYYGHVRYHIKSTICTGPLSFDSKTLRPLIVNEVIDTNDSKYSQRHVEEMNKTFGIFKKEDLHFNGSIARSCFCPGESINVNSLIDNKTGKTMKMIKGKLIQKVTYTSSMGWNQYETKTLCKLHGPAIPKGECVKWVDQEYVVPACPPSINTTVVQVHYTLLLEIEAPFGSSNPKLNIPIIIGTVPYRGHQFQSKEMEASLSQQGFPSAPPIQPQVFGYPNMAPPSYAAVMGAEAVQAKEDKHTFGDLSYLPKYTFTQPFQETTGTSNMAAASAPSQDNPPAYPQSWGIQPSSVPGPQNTHDIDPLVEEMEKQLLSHN